MQLLNLLIDKVIFYNDQNYYCVLRCKLKHIEVDVIGHFKDPKPGLILNSHGEWIVDQKFGKQFKAALIEICLPKEPENIIKYLSSGRIKGIGENLAQSIVEQFGRETLSIINEQPKKLLEVNGIGKSKYESIIQSLEKDATSQESILFMQSLGISPNKSEKIFNFYGIETISIIKNNPYRLSYDLMGFGFIICDKIALSLGIKKDSSLRINAGIVYMLEEFSQHGHCWVPRTKLIEKTSEKLDLKAELIAEELKNSNEFIEQWTHDQQDAIALSSIKNIEEEISSILKKRNSTPFNAIQGKISTYSFSPTEEQVQCVSKTLSLQNCVITGGPGVGKTTLVKLILDALLSAGRQVMLCAPTGRAAKRLHESTGFESKTIHRLLEYDPITKGFKRNQHSPLTIDCLIIDEFSMVDIHLFHHLLKAIPIYSQMIIVGDVDQLPSIGPGAILRDLIISYPQQVIRLTHVFRQAASSMIITNAHNINQGKLPIKKDDSDCYVIEIQETQKIFDTVIELVTNRIPKKFGFDALHDIQVLSPTKKGPLGSQLINHHLAQKINPNPTSIIDYQGQRFATGDKVIVQRNNYEKDIFNGDIGIIKYYENKEFGIEFNQKIVKFKQNELDELMLAYAITIHKSQGSEYPVIVMPLAMSHFLMLNKNLIYTGLTRAKKLAVIVTQKKALIMAIKVNASPQRYTLLHSLLTENITLD